MEVFKLFLIRAVISAVLWFITFMLSNNGEGGWALLIAIAAFVMSFFTLLKLVKGS